jgi:2-dehydro-3-deoxygluconokinase
VNGPSRRARPNIPVWQRRAPLFSLDPIAGAHTAFDLVTVGESMVQLTPDPLGPLEDAVRASVAVAGAESTVAMYLAQLGRRTAWVSAVGDDPFGRRILTDLGSAGVDISYAINDSRSQTGVYFKDPSPEGRTAVRYYRADSAASRMTIQILTAAGLQGCAVLHLTGITAALSPGCEGLVYDALWRRPLGRGLASFDVNYRSSLWPVAEAAPVLLRLAALADLVLVGLDEAQLLWEVETAADVRRLIPEPARVVVKDGAIGATAFVADADPTFVSASEVDVIEPIGAGDGFAAGYLHGHLLNLNEAARLSIGHQVAAASLVVTADVGAVPDSVPRAVAPSIAPW